MSDSKQAKYIRNNYKRLSLDLKPDILELFKQKCSENGTKPTTEIKKFIDDYIKSNTK